MMFNRILKMVLTAANLAVLRRHLKPGLVSNFWQRMVAAGAPSYRPCPVCHDTMHSFEISLDGHEISLDLCKKCQVIWFDAGELEALPKTPPQVEDMPPEVKREVAVLDAYRNYGMENPPPDDGSAQVEMWAETAIQVFYLVLRVLLKF